MPGFQYHAELASELWEATQKYYKEGEWPVVVDGGYYCVLHSLEALNALNYCDTSSFADVVDIMEKVLIPKYLGDGFMSLYDYLFYFRRGTIYGPHIPGDDQMKSFYEAVEKAYTQIKSAIDQNC